MPPISELTRIEPIHLERLEHQGILTTGLPLDVSEIPTRRQTLADQVAAWTDKIPAWRDEVLLLNPAGFGATEHEVLRLAGNDGRRALLAIQLEPFRAAVARSIGRLGVGAPSDLVIETSWEQARRLEDE